MWRKTQTKTRHFCSLLLLLLLLFLLLLLNTPLLISIACNEPMKQLRCKIIYSVLFQGGVLVSRLFIYLSQCTVFAYFLRKTLQPNSSQRVLSFSYGSLEIGWSRSSSAYRKQRPQHYRLYVHT